MDHPLLVILPGGREKDQRRRCQRQEERQERGENSDLHSDLNQTPFLSVSIHLNSRDEDSSPSRLS